MSEVNADVILGRKRRLPSWISGGAAAEAVTANATSEAIDAADEQLQPTGAPSSKKVRGEGILSGKEAALELETKRRNRKRSVIDGGLSASCLSSQQTKLRRREPRSNDGGRRGKRRTIPAEETDETRYVQERHNVDQVDGSDGEVMALTVEDLISLAQEFVNADAKKRRQEAAATTMATTADYSRTKFSRVNSSVSVKRSLDVCSGSTASISGSLEGTLLPCNSTSSLAEKEEEHHEPVSMKRGLDVCSGSTGFITGSSERTLLPCSSISYQAEQEEEHHEPVSMKRGLDVCSGSIGFITGSSERTLLPCSSRSYQAEQEEEHHNPESSTLETTRTGDVAQDMLNLFLGPLLQKSDPSRRKLDNCFPCEPIKHSSSEIALAMKVGAPSEKKKSSLKDKVSLFLS